MEYKVVTAQNLLSSTKSLAKLTAAVNEALRMGWEPVGGIALSEHGLVAQALIKRR